MKSGVFQNEVFGPPRLIIDNNRFPKHLLYFYVIQIGINLLSCTFYTIWLEMFVFCETSFSSFRKQCIIFLDSLRSLQIVILYPKGAFTVQHKISSFIALASVEQ